MRAPYATPLVLVAAIVGVLALAQLGPADALGAPTAQDRLRSWAVRVAAW